MRYRRGIAVERGHGIRPVASRAAGAAPTRPAGAVAGESVLGGVESYRDDTAVAFVGRGRRSRWPSYLDDWGVRASPAGCAYPFHAFPSRTR